MNMKLLGTLVLGLGLGALAGWWLRPASPIAPDATAPAAAPAAREILFYRNPMGLADTSPVPKKDSMGMDYVPVYAEAARPAASRILFYRNPMGLADTSPVPKKDSMGMDYVPVYAADAPSTPGTVSLSPQKVQMLGVRTVMVARKALRVEIRASGVIQIDQTREHVIAPKFDGWIEQLYANQVGQSLRRGQPLMAVYSPELVSTQNEFLIAQSAARSLSDSSSAAAMASLSDAALQRLRSFDIPPSQLQKLRAGQIQRRLTLTAPVDAVIMQPPMVAGSRFMAGDTVLTLADLSRVWLVAAIPTQTSAQVQLGQTAQFSSAALPGQVFAGTVDFIEPMLDAKMRTLGVRIELANPDGVLRPALYGDVLLTADSGEPQLLLPRSAILDSGQRQLVFGEVSDGRYEPREVTLGERSGDQVVVREGVGEGEKVVVAANFLIDAESNLGAALHGMLPGSEEIGSDTEAPRDMTPVPVDAEHTDSGEH
jgi:membrane fusion protein, copper/silver efflux system